MKARITTKLIESLRPEARPYEVVDADSPQSIPGFRVRVEPSGLMVYRLRYRWQGKERNERLGGVRELPLPRARELARGILAQAKEAQHGRADDPAEAKRRPKHMTVGEWVEGEYARSLSHRRTGKSLVDRIRRNFRSCLFEKRLDDPTILQTVVLWRQDRLDAGITPKTCNTDIAALRSALTAAVDREIIEIHPLQRLKPLRHADNTRVRYLSPEEERRLWSAIDRREERIRSERNSANAWRTERGYAQLADLRENAFADFLKPLIVVAMHTGMRRGELFSLDWSDVDEQSGTILVRAETAKTGKARRIPMNQVVLDVLDKWREQSTSNGFVFKSPVTGGRLDNIASSWQALMLDGEIENFRFHDLRHHFASMLAMAGVPLNNIRELLGHANMTMTLRYAHLAPDHGRDAVARLALRHQKFQDGNITPFRKTENAEQES